MDERMTIDIGIDEQARADRERLSRVLADTYTLYIKVHNFHWNLTPDVLGAAPDVRDGSDRS